MHFEILGEPCSKANSRRIVKAGNRVRSIKSDKALVYEKAALLQFKQQLGRKHALTGPVGVEITIWYASRRPDLDPSIILDVMQKAGVYANDRQVMQMSLFKELDKAKPRASIEVWALE